MNDLISRQAAIDYINRAIPEWSEDKETAIDCLQNTPPVQPERKKGKWIQKENVYGVVYCSKCDYELHTNDTNFCPNCGADMRGE